MTRPNQLSVVVENIAKNLRVGVTFLTHTVCHNDDTPVFTAFFPF